MLIAIGAKVQKYAGGHIHIISGYVSFQGEPMYQFDNGLLFPVSCSHFLRLC